MTRTTTSHDITGTTLAVLWIGALILAAFWIVNPFLVPTVWAGMAVVATWPVLLRVEKLLWGRRGLAAVAMTAMLTLMFVLPLLGAVSIVVANMDRIGDWIKSGSTFVIPQPPDRLASLPVVGLQAFGGMAGGCSGRDCRTLRQGGASRRKDRELVS